MREVIFSLVTLGSVGFIFAVLLAFLNKKLSVKEDERLQKILSVLPGINCGACGFSGCRAFAEAIIKKNSIFSGCIPGGASVNENIKNILGISKAAIPKRRIAICHCTADKSQKKSSSDYYGVLTCKAADIAGGGIDCVYGCLGLGDCSRVCPVGAITLREGRVYVDINLCIGCGKCVEACPRGLFELVEFDEKALYYVGCNNREKAIDVKRVCSKGCMGCGICSRLKDSPFKVEENISRIDRKKKVSLEILEEASSKCPTKCIVNINV